MIKINNVKLDTSIQIYLPEKWHEKIINDNPKMSSFPYEFTYEKTEKIGEIIIHIFKSKNKYIGFSEDIINYLLGNEVPDTNVGFLFKEFLPNENTDLIITSTKCDKSILVANLSVDKEIMEIDEIGKINFFDFYLTYIDGSQKTALSRFASKNKSEWKFLFTDDISYMSDIEKMYQDTFVHKKYVFASCRKLANYLRECGMVNHASLLMDRAITHDDSKIKCEDETRALSQIINDKSCLSDANKALSQIKTDAIQLHWKHNSHHPEHFANFADMEKIDILEMVCDWHARSVQYKTDLIEFLEVRQKDRFHFPEYMYLEIKHYCEILLK